MSGRLHTPLIAADQASKLLEEVIYERVLSFIDLDGLFGFEQELWSALDDCGVPEREIGDRAKALIDRAFQRINDDPRRYGVFIGEGDDCGLCEQAAAAIGQKRRTS